MRLRSPLIPLTLAKALFISTASSPGACMVSVVAATLRVAKSRSKVVIVHLEASDTDITARHSRGFLAHHSPTLLVLEPSWAHRSLETLLLGRQE